MKSNFFKDCTSLAEVKKRYKELAMLHHPDRGGDTATMQEINNQYESISKNQAFNFAKQTEQEKEDFLRYPDIINMVVNLEGIIIEIIGDWIWISGNTYPHRQHLKESGFYFAPKKVMWYYRPAEYKAANSKPKDIDEIRAKYGSDLVQNQSRHFNLR
jgi:curved DNA-binding protein CbpA